MNKRQLRRLETWERDSMASRALRAIDDALNLYGVDETPLRELRDAPVSELDSMAEKLLEPECNCRARDCQHAFPPWLMREAAPTVYAYVRLRKQLGSLA